LSTERPDEEAPVMVHEFRGLRVEIGRRVQNEWRKVPIAEKSRLLESALAAWKKHDQRFKYGPMIKAIEERKRGKARHSFSLTAFLHHPGFARLKSEPGVFRCKLRPETNKRDAKHSDYSGTLLMAKGERASVRPWVHADGSLGLRVALAPRKESEPCR
jgi:hypothetical protein